MDLEILKELRLQLEQTKVLLQELETKSVTLRWSLAAFQFVQQRQAAGSPPLLITPTVGLELSMSLPKRTPTHVQFQLQAQ
jgi:hypothetical protein